MLSTLSRRRRRLLVAVLSGVLFVVLVVATLIVVRSPREVYRPGEDVEGLTSKLDRSLPDDAPRIEFTDVTREAGIDFVHFPGRRTSQLPEDMGSGAAWGDFDNDGWEDLYVVNIAGPITMSAEELSYSPHHNVLFRNNGDGTFSDVSRAAGVDLRAWGSAAAWGDFDNDGFVDLVTTSYGRNVLFRNVGDGTFRDVTSAAGMDAESAFWTGASWGDYNLDGRLDLYITGYVRYEERLRSLQSLQYDVESPASINPSSFEPERNLLYRNNGGGTFTEVASLAGVENRGGRSLAAAWSDFDSDGWPDLYVANDVSDNVFYRNLGNGVFEDVSHRALVADYRGAMGLAIGDWDGDHDQDLFITHWIAQENALYDNQLFSQSGRPGLLDSPIRFMDAADRLGLGQSALDYVGWGTSFFDYDSDGRPDLFVVNGHTLQQSENSELLEPMTDRLYWNGGVDRGFFDVSSVSGYHFSTERVGRGAAIADYDNDGDVDVFIVNHQGPAVLLNNAGHPSNHWIQIRVEGRTSTRLGIGALIRVVAAGGSLVQEVGSQPSYLSQNSTVSHFGLGNAVRIDTVEVRWPSGRLSIATDLAPNQRIVVVEPEEGE